MNCPTIDKLSQYVDELLLDQERQTIETHIKSCYECQKIVQMFKEEQQFLQDTLQTPTLPDDFAEKIIDKLEPYEPKKRKKKKPVWKQVLLAAATIGLVLGISSTFSPSFAQWIGGFFSTDQVDEGLQIATDAGFSKRVNKEVTDRGITFKVEDIVADSSRIALSYQILKGNKPQHAYLDIPNSKNQVRAFDEKGNEIYELGTSWGENSDYGLIEFSLRDYKALKEVTVKFDLTELHGKKGNWQLEIPVNLTESLKSTKVIALKDAQTNRQGVAIQMKEARFTPSSNELLYETGFTKEEQAKVKAKLQKFEEQFGKDVVNLFTQYETGLDYQIVNEKGKVVFANDPFLAESTRLLQATSSSTDTFGFSARNDSFTPTKDENQLTFVLSGVVKTVPTDFSITFNPKELKKNPVTFEYDGNELTIKKAKMHNDYSLKNSLKPIRKQTYLKIEMEGYRDKFDPLLREWAIVDDKGRSYEVYDSGSSYSNEKDETGRYKQEVSLIIYGPESTPEEVSLHLLSKTEYEKVKEPWEVPLYNHN